MSRRGRILLIAGGIALLLLITGSRLLNTYVEWLWYGEVGFRGVFTTAIITRLVQLVIVGLFVGGLLALNLVLAYRARPVFVPVSGPEDPIARYRTAVVTKLRLIGIGLPVVVGLLAGLAAQGDWQVTQLFLNSTTFGVEDPEFGRDISFYAFQLPFYRMILDWLFVAVVVSFLAALITHYLFGGIRLAGRSGQLAGPARVQLAILAGVFVLLKAVAYWMDRFFLLFSSRNAEQFYGASYTDLAAVMPAKLILLIIAVFCAAAFFTGAVVRNLQIPAIAIVLMLVSSILIGTAWPALLQQFSVNPNAQQKEAQTIERNIEATKQAFGLTDDKVTFVDYEGTAEVTAEQVAEDTTTMPNVRLLDPTVISRTFTQQQQRRNFYGFPDTLDIDRYTVDGKKQDYIVALREIDTDGLAENQQNWINRHLVYTHGNGFVAAPANTVQAASEEAGGAGGYPRYTVSDTSTQGDIEVDQPRIYYGELGTDYAIVGKTSADEAPREFDGGGGDDDGEDGGEEKYSYTGSGGVEIGSYLRRLIFSAQYGERNILFSDQIGSDSKVIYKRNPKDRVEAVAPWLTVDSDPYPAVVDGRITWILDGYTMLDHYPYAQQIPLQQTTTDSLVTTAGQQQQLDRRVSYMRNSVKATVDAYDGTVTMYAMDEEDPVLKTWMGVFPDTVKPSSELSDELREHFRYPVDLFKVQRHLLTKYHVSNPARFFSNEDFWSVPTDPTLPENAPAANQPPYYILAANPESPDATEPTFQLTSVMTPLRREFMSAFVSASSEPDSYGDITVRKLPSETQTRGPQQVQNDFKSSAKVSTEINLLTQQETRVIYGNLLTLPVAEGLIYVEPVYIERTGQESSFPQLNRVLVYHGGRVGYAPNLRDALEEVLGEGAGETTTPPEEGEEPPTDETPPPTTDTEEPPPDGDPAADMAEAVADIGDAIERVKQAQADGDFAALGQAYEDLADATERFEQARAAQDGG